MRTFGVIFTEKWNSVQMDFVQAKNHKDVSKNLPKKCKRVNNARYREIEQTGVYYAIFEHIKGGKTFIFEVV